MVLFLSIRDLGYCRALKITTWNIEWLLSAQDVQKFKLPKDISFRTSNDFIKLKSIINTLDADIFAFQEVGSLDTLKSIFPKNRYNFFITKDDIAQHTAIAVKKNPFITVYQQPDVSSLSLNNNHHRLRSGLELTLSFEHQYIKILVIHLKFGCAQDNSTNIKTICPILNKQFSLLLEWIQQRIKQKESFIILGDFNRVIASKDTFFQRLIHLNLLLPTLKKATPCGGGNYFIDGFILSPEIEQWFKKDSLKVSLMNILQKEGNLSDHCPVSIWINTP